MAMRARVAYVEDHVLHFCYGLGRFAHASLSYKFYGIVFLLLPTFAVSWLYLHGFITVTVPGVLTLSGLPWIPAR